MKRKFTLYLLLIITCICFLMFGACNNGAGEKEKTIEGIKSNYSVKLNENDFNYLSDITNGSSITVDDSEVDYSHVGKYKVKFSSDGIKMTSSVGIYGMPVFYGEDITILLSKIKNNPYESLYCLDSFGEPLTMELKTDINTVTEIGEYVFEYSAKDSAGNVASFQRTINITDAETFYGRVINDRQGLELWSIGPWSRQKGSTISFDEKEQAYRLDNRFKISSELPKGVSYTSASAFTFGGFGSSFTTFASKYYDSIVFEWKSPDVPMVEISQQGVGPVARTGRKSYVDKEGQRVVTGSTTNEYRENILPLTMYNSKMWNLMFSFELPDDKDCVSVYVRNIRFVKSEDYLNNHKFNGKKYLSMFEDPSINKDINIKEQTNTICWDESQQTFKLTSRLVNNNQNIPGFNFGDGGLIDTAFGTDPENPVYDAIKFSWKMEIPAKIDINWQGYATNLGMAKGANDWQTVVVPIKWENLIKNNYTGMDHRFALLSFCTKVTPQIPENSIYLKDIEFIKLSDYMNVELNGEKYMSLWSKMGYTDKQSESLDTVVYNEQENAYELTHFNKNGKSSAFAFGGAGHASLLTELYNKYGVDTVSLKVKQTDIESSLVVNSQTMAESYKANIYGSEDWQEVTIGIYHDAKYSYNLCFTNWYPQSGEGSIKVLVKDIKFYKSK